MFLSKKVQRQNSFLAVQIVPYSLSQIWRVFYTPPNVCLSMRKSVKTDLNDQQNLIRVKTV